MAFVNVCETIERAGLGVTTARLDGTDVSSMFHVLQIQWKKAPSMSPVKR
jgi:hypothetical protein